MKTDLVFSVAFLEILGDTSTGEFKLARQVFAYPSKLKKFNKNKNLFYES
jgi:hypothetical protein